MTRRAGILLGFALGAFIGAWVAAYLSAFVLDWHDPINAFGNGAVAYPLILLIHAVLAGVGSLVFWGGLLVGRGLAPRRLCWAVALSTFLGVAYAGALVGLAWMDVGPAAFWALAIGLPGCLGLVVGERRTGRQVGQTHAAEQRDAAAEARAE